jgi:tetratricopeptide (TPR) repeat protein
LDDAAKAYQQSFQAAALDYQHTGQAAPTLEPLNYALFQAAKVLQAQSKWADIVTMFEGFIKANPDHPTVVAAISWIGRADIKLGKVEEAKQYMADTAKKYLNDPTREGVDEIIDQLAQLYAHRHLPLAPPAAAAPANASASTGTTTALAGVTAPAGTNSAPADATASLPTDAASAPASAPVAPATTTPPDPAQGLVDILTIPDLDSQPTASARILFAKAELARMQRKKDVQAQFLLQIAQQFKPEDLSPLLLGEVGDCLFQNGRLQDAAPFYHELIDSYPKSSLVDFGYNGVGQIAYSQKDYKTADKYFWKALDKGFAASKLKDITLTEAETLLAMNRFAAAEPLFSEVASTRAWRGEATALSVYSLGEVKMGLGDDAEASGNIQKAQDYYAKANAFYQRVYVAYQKFPAIQAKAYLRSGEAFEKMVKIPEAINTYAEMINHDKNPRLASFPETAQAAQNLQRLRSLSPK